MKRTEEATDKGRRKLNHQPRRGGAAQPKARTEANGPDRTCILRVHVGWVVAKLDEDRDGHPELEPLHNIGRGLPGHGVDHVASQNHGLASSRRHKLGLLSQAVGS